MPSRPALIVAAEGEAAPLRPAASRLAAALRARLPAAELAARALAEPFAHCLARWMRYDLADPAWPDRDRVVLAPGCASLGPAAAALLGGAASFPSSSLVFGLGAGLALAERHLASRFGRSLTDHATWIFADGALLATGGAQEAACLAGAWRLGRLTAIVSAPASPAAAASFAAHGWAVRRPGGDPGQIAAALSAAARSHRPNLILCAAEAALPDADETEAREATFEAAGRRGAANRRAWLKRLARHASRADHEATLSARAPALWPGNVPEPGAALPGATLPAAVQALGQLSAAMPGLARLPAFPDPGFAALVHGGSALLCGLGLHGFVPYGVHQLGDLGIMLPSLHCAASLNIRLISVLIEPCAPASGSRAVLRAMDNLLVMRPASAAETLECLDIALRRTAGPAVLLVSEQPAPALARPRGLVARGGYLLIDPPARAATLIASGTEIAIAVEAAGELAAHGIPVAVLSLPCWDLFGAAPQDWRGPALGHQPRIGLENSGGFGWERWLGPGGLFIDTRRAASARAVATQIHRHLAKLNPG